MNDIRTLEKADFCLDAKHPVVTVKAEHEKAKRGAVLPLSGDSSLAADLVAHFESRPLMLLEGANTRAFPNMPTKGAEMLRADAQYARKRLRVERYMALRRAEESKAVARKEAEAMGDSDFLKIETAQGRIVFHALRHTFGTWLARSGVHPKVCQEMMRHIAFPEDECRVRKDNGTANFAILGRFALNLVKRDTTCKVGVAIKRLRTLANADYRKHLLLGAL